MRFVEILNSPMLIATENQHFYRHKLGRATHYLAYSKVYAGISIYLTKEIKEINCGCIVANLYKQYEAANSE
jgi:hypothetical protein